MADKRELVLNYCKTVNTHNVDHLQSAIENGEYDMLNGCPSAYGLDDYVGLCEIEEDAGQDLKKQSQQCLNCWKKALDVN